MLDVCGYDGVICADHLVYPRDLRSPYPSAAGVPPWPPETAWPDSWIMIGAMASTTRRLRFSNAIYVAASRPLVEVAKQVATASVISGGRVSLAVGAGWMREEFELLGQDFSTRGRRLDEMIPALRALWSGGWVSWSGRYYDVPELMLEPHPPNRLILAGTVAREDAVAAQALASPRMRLAMMGVRCRTNDGHLEPLDGR